MKSRWENATAGAPFAVRRACCSTRPLEQTNLHAQLRPAAMTNADQTTTRSRLLTMGMP
jgi:hypothetical protein